jgi:hypothetical protein
VKSPPIPPFRLAADVSVAAEAWLLDESAVLDVLDDWDPDRDLDLTRRVTVNLADVCISAGLPLDAPLALLARWRSDVTRMGGSASVDLPPGSRRGEQDVEMRVRVPGARAGGTLSLETLVVLRSPTTGTSHAVASRAGAILWRDITTVALEGGAARFPMSAASFAVLGHVPDGAWWYVDIASASFDTPFLRAIRVLVNSDVPGLSDALRTDSGLAQSAAVTSMLVNDVSRSLIAMGLAGTDALVPDEIEDESLGAAIMESIRNVWPGAPLMSLVERWKSDRTLMEAEIQAQLGLEVVT